MKLPGVLLVCAALASCGHPPTHKRVIVLGVDGMDPHFIEAHWDQLSNLRQLCSQGSFSTLATTTPPQSPVAWSTFSTGLDPIEHGLFDFVHRDPATMQPISSFAETLPALHRLEIGPYLLPLSRPQVRSFRSGRTFWEILAEHGIPTTVIRMPANYPVAHAGEELAGMGTPDLEGTFGTFTWYSDDPLDIARDVPGGRIVPVRVTDGRAILPVEGPPNTLRRDGARVELSLIADVDAPASAARFTIGEQQFILKQGEWSPWIRVRFPLIGGVANVAGMFRVYAQRLQDGLRIYRTPLNIDPLDPALPISSPSAYSRDLAQRIGPFYTQGIEEDTAALRQGVLTLPEYLAQSRMVQREHLAMLRDALSRFHDGLLFFYFSEIDQDSHMLWGRHEDELLQTYRAVGDAIAMVARQAADADIIVMSDHGFAAFDHAFHLNTWLQRQGFLVTGPVEGSGGRMDWSRTKAYAMGLNALYINRDGTEREALTIEIMRRLQAEKPAIENVVRLPKSGNRYAPDLIVGYAPGYRASWETALGELSSEVITDNDDAWIGDHCMAAEAVPGVLVSNRKFSIRDPQLKDLTVTILREYGIPPDPKMKGRAIY